MKILVLGSSGQLANHLKIISNKASAHSWTFLDRSQCDLANSHQVENLSTQNFDVLINAAAYTNVELAEEQAPLAFTINKTAVSTMAHICQKKKAKLLHFSTDYVFDGKKTSPYIESDAVNPLNVYGKSKLEGEGEIAKSGCKYLIIRTSWVYSKFGKNFFKTIYDRSNTQDLNIVCDQIGTPTFAGDLAELSNLILEKHYFPRDIVHYSNEGVASWYDFAQHIVRGAGHEHAVRPTDSRAYPQKATRPSYSVLSKEKIKAALGIEIPYWVESLEKLIKTYSV